MEVLLRSGSTAARYSRTAIFITPAALYHREDGGDLRSSLSAAEMDPVLLAGPCAQSSPLPRSMHCWWLWGTQGCVLSPARPNVTHLHGCSRVREGTALPPS